MDRAHHHPRSRLPLGCEPGLFVRHARTQALGDFGQTEIEHLHLPPRGDHQVGALDVAVDDAAPVRLLQRLGNLDADVDRFAEGERPPLSFCESGSPSTYSMTMKAWPSCSPMS